MESKEIKAYIRKFSRDWGLDKHPTCLICGKEIREEDADKLEATKSKAGVVLIHKKCWKKEKQTWMKK